MSSFRVNVYTCWHKRRVGHSGHSGHLGTILLFAIIVRLIIHNMWIVFLVFIFIDRHTYCAGHSGHMGTFFYLSYIMHWVQWAHGHIL